MNKSERGEYARAAVSDMARETRELWDYAASRMDPATGYVPIEVINDFLGRGGTSTIVANELIARGFVDRTVLEVEIEEELKEREEQ